ncbi:MAG TPA: hypothetical protein H9894_09385 [Candidatus Desulfovibrio intestinipullorum]|uniref:Uncharacterized protein n=1 Tax=Candidatus Desulfovibrio intestinipullorum TaxID=2838536 RepID=A0A9D1PY46_9BACT|nr:hypothetical protein [Candidatus Desulfovibrio intestinipullorum]
MSGSSQQNRLCKGAEQDFFSQDICNYLKEQREKSLNYLDSCLICAVMKGKTEGKSEERRRIARNLKQLGISDSVIRKATGLDVRDEDGEEIL